MSRRTLLPACLSSLLSEWTFVTVPFSASQRNCQKISLSLWGKCNNTEESKIDSFRGVSSAVMSYELWQYGQANMIQVSSVKITLEWPMDSNRLSGKWIANLCWQPMELLVVPRVLGVRRA